MTLVGNIADAITAIGVALKGKQPLDTDLSTLAALSPSNDDIVQRKSGAWANRTLAQLKTDLTLSGTNTGDQTSVSGNAGTATALATARTINGTSFDGTANIFVPCRQVISATNTTSWTIALDGSGLNIYAQNTGLTGAVTLNNPTGTPVMGQMLQVALTGTASRAISYGTAFEDSTLTRPTTTSGTARLDLIFVWNTATSKWRYLGQA